MASPEKSSEAAVEAVTRERLYMLCSLKLGPSRTI